jgi:hypothetical protein
MLGSLKIGTLFLLLLAAGAARADTVVPDSTIIPVRLNSTLSSRSAKPGQLITARVMQDVPLPDNAKIPAGATLAGKVTSVQRASGSNGGSISLVFQTLRIPHENIRLTVRLRAIASMLEVRQAELPRNSDPTAAENSWTTLQIGGDVVYRGGGPVRNRSGVVGRPVDGGVLARLDSNPGRGCRHDSTGERAQALWLFSSDACGAYGLPNLTIAGDRSDATGSTAGEITLRSAQGDVDVRNGSGLLLRVDAPGVPGA